MEKIDVPTEIPTWAIRYVSSKQFDTTVPYVDKVKSVKKTRGFPNRGERYGAKYENLVPHLLSYSVSVENMWTQNTRIIHDVSRLLILSNEEKRMIM